MISITFSARGREIRYEYENVSTIFLLFCSDWTRWALNNFKIIHFCCQINKSYKSFRKKPRKFNIVTTYCLNWYSCGICYEIEKVNTQFVVGKFYNENPVVHKIPFLGVYSKLYLKNSIINMYKKEFIKVIYF